MRAKKQIEITTYLKTRKLDIQIIIQENIEGKKGPGEELRAMV